MSRLESKLRGMWETNWNPEKPLYGTVTSSGFAVLISPWLRRAPNPYFLRGVFTSSAAGTTIRAKYGLLTTYRLFVAGMASFFLFTGWLVLQHAPPQEFSPFFGTMSFLIVLYIHWGIRRLNRMAEWDRELILDAVAEILEARIEPPEAAS